MKNKKKLPPVDMERKPVETVRKDGHTITFIGQFNPWKYAEAMAAIAGKRYNAKVTVTNIIRKEDGSHVPR